MSWMLSATPARNGETLLIATYDLLGCNLANGFDLCGTQVTGRFDTETVILRARQPRLVEGKA